MTMNEMKRMRALICALLCLLLLLVAAFACAEEANSKAAYAGLNITPIFEVLLSAVTIIITRKLLPWLKANTTAEKYRTLATLVDCAVYSAEQLYGAKHGDEKLSYAVEWLKARGVYIDEEDMKDRARAMIEASVYRMHQYEESILEAVPIEAVVSPAEKAAEPTTEDDDEDDDDDDEDEEDEADITGDEEYIVDIEEDAKPF